MKLTFSNTKQLNRAWKPDFLGLQGFLLPRDQNLELGQELEINLVVNKQECGSANAKVTWQNLYGQNSELTPRGIFIALTSADSKLRHQLNIK